MQTRNSRQISFCENPAVSSADPLSESQSRVYKLLSDERCLSVMAVMRIDSAEVTQLGQARSNRFELLQAEQRRCGELIAVNKHKARFARKTPEPS